MYVYIYIIIHTYTCWIPIWVGLRIGNPTVYHASSFPPAKEFEDPSVGVMCPAAKKAPSPLGLRAKMPP